MKGKGAEDSLARCSTTLPLTLRENLVVHVPSQLDEATRMPAGSLERRERKWISEAQNGHDGIIVEVEHSCLFDRRLACRRIVFGRSVEFAICEKTTATTIS